jgi:hypothetical protein
MNKNKIKNVVTATYACQNQWNLPREINKSYSYHVEGNVLFVRWNMGEEYHRYKAVYEDIESDWYPDLPIDIDVYTHNHHLEKLSEIIEKG